LVINLSFGNSYGSHDGSSLLERFLDNAAEIGRTVICVGSGNEGSAGGHFENAELNDPESCVLRELREELSLEASDLEGMKLRYVTHRLKDGEIRQNYYFFASLKEEKELCSTEGRLEWIPLTEIPQLNMPVSAKHMILHYLAKGRLDQNLYCGITTPEGTSFVPMEEFEG